MRKKPYINTPDEEQPPEVPATDPPPIDVTPDVSAVDVDHQTLAALQAGTLGDFPLSPFNPDPGGRRRIASSLSPAKPENRKIAYRAVTGQDHEAADVIGRVFSVRDWLCHDVEKPNEEGEIEKWVRTVLICEDGTRISCGSAGVISSIISLEAFWLRAPWSPALELSVEAIKRKDGKGSYYTLDIH